MTIAIWPSALPKPERDSWNAGHQDARQARRSDAGPPSYRRRFSSAARSVSLSLLLDRNGKAIFDNFYRDDCRRGTVLFEMPDPTTDGWPLLLSEGSELLTSDNVPILLFETWLCAFGDQLPQERIVGVEFRIAFSVWVMP